MLNSSPQSATPPTPTATTAHNYANCQTRPSAEAVASDGALGAATCFIGVLCTLLIFTLIRAFVLRGQAAPLRAPRVRRPLRVMAMPGGAPPSPISLVQLSISRT